MKIVKNNKFWSSIGTKPEKAGYFTQFEIISHIGDSRSRFDLRSDIVNLKWVNLRLIVLHEENVNCTGTHSHFIVLSGHLRVSLT